MLRASLRTLSLGCALSLASACGSEDGDAPAENPCQVGFTVLSQVLAELKSNLPACQSDADCVMMSARLECAGNVAATCGEAVDRRVVEHYDQAQANARFCARIKLSKYGCSVQPSCAATKPVCEAGQCAARVLP